MDITGILPVAFDRFGGFLISVYLTGILPVLSINIPHDADNTLTRVITYKLPSGNK